MAWTPSDMPDQTGRTVVVTGGNSGIGFPTALELARKGAGVMIAARDEARGAKAVARIEAAAPGKASFHRLDLADLDSVDRFAEAAPASVDVLINNAGVMMTPEWKTAQGYEMQWGVNVVGHAHLTKRLIDRISDRVVTISSIAHQKGHIDPDSWRDPAHYNPWRAYSQSKLGDLLFAQELDRHLKAQGSAVRSVAAHPGVSLTRLSRNMPLALKLTMLMYVPFLQPAARGALPTLYAATMDVPGASYWGPKGFREWRGAPAEAEIFPHARDRDLAKQVFDAVWQ